MKSTITIRINPDLDRTLSKLMKRRDYTLSNLVENIFSQEIPRYEALIAQGNVTLKDLVDIIQRWNNKQAEQHAGAPVKRSISLDDRLKSMLDRFCDSLSGASKNDVIHYILDRYVNTPLKSDESSTVTDYRTFDPYVDEDTTLKDYDTAIFGSLKITDGEAFVKNVIQKIPEKVLVNGLYAVIDQMKYTEPDLLVMTSRAQQQILDMCQRLAKVLKEEVCHYDSNNR